MRAQATISDFQLVKATGKTWQQWTDALADAPPGMASCLRQNYHLDFWWSEAIAKSFEKPTPQELHKISSHSFIKLFKACNASPTFGVSAKKPAISLRYSI